MRPRRQAEAGAQREYGGPGVFAHTYFETLLRPGVYDDPPEAH